MHIANAREVGPTHCRPDLPQDPGNCTFVGERNSISATLDSGQRQQVKGRDFLLDGIKHGFRIIREGSNATPVEQKNYRSALREK